MLHPSIQIRLRFKNFVLLLKIHIFGVFESVVSDTIFVVLKALILNVTKTAETDYTIWTIQRFDFNL